MGVVYRARHRYLQREVALKMISSHKGGAAESIRRFHIEAQAIARLKHPNVVQVHEFNLHEGRPYLVMELVEGDSLQQVISARPWRNAQRPSWC